MVFPVSMGTKYSHLGARERDVLGFLKSAGRSVREIARKLGRHPSTISRELKRNNSKGKYLSIDACERAKRRKKEDHRRDKLRDKKIRAYVVKKLNMGWSPELIAGRLSMEHKGLDISHETIYRWIYGKEPKYIECLTRGHKRRKRRGHYAKKRHKHNIPCRVGIECRPEIINRRKEAGHWEVDTAFFCHCPESLHVMAERKSRYTKLTKLKDYTADAAKQAMVKRHRCTPIYLKRSFTYDNGRENTGHIWVNNNLGTNSFFCNPGASWEKGTVENTIGIIRRYLPKKIDFARISEVEIARLERWINNRPRKCLGFKTPYEAYRSECCT